MRTKEEIEARIKEYDDIIKKEGDRMEFAVRAILTGHIAGLKYALGDDAK